MTQKLESGRAPAVPVDDFSGRRKVHEEIGARLIATGLYDRMSDFTSDAEAAALVREFIALADPILDADHARRMDRLRRAPESEDAPPVHDAATVQLAGWTYPTGGRTRFADTGDTVSAEVAHKMRPVFYLEGALDSFQARVQPWMLSCFGPEVSADRRERSYRFFEEAIELVQANGLTASQAHELVDYTFNRPVGEVKQEIKGVMITFAALCNACGVGMLAAGEEELARVWTTIETIRAKQANKPHPNRRDVEAP